MNKSQKRSILLVDDNPDDLVALQRACSSLEGVAVKIAGDVYTASDLLHDEYFDLIIVDIHMPDTSGPKLLSMLHSIDSKIVDRTVLVTGVTPPSRLMKWITANGLDFVMKPLDRDQIVRLLDRSEVFGWSP